MIKRSVTQEKIAILSVCTPNDRISKCIKQKLIGLLMWFTTLRLKTTNNKQSS
jgi:hypothetical protein